MLLPAVARQGDEGWDLLRAVSDVRSRAKAAGYSIGVRAAQALRDRIYLVWPGAVHHTLTCMQPDPASLKKQHCHYLYHGHYLPIACSQIILQVSWSSEMLPFRAAYSLCSAILP